MPSKISYPVNYDFGTNWDTKIKPFLDHPKIKRAIRKGVNDYLSMFPTNERYKENTVPAYYSSKDGHMTLMDRKSEELFDVLRKLNLLPKKLLKLEKLMYTCDEDDADNYGDKYFEMRMKFMNKFFTWDMVKYDLETYYLSGSCHWYAPTFELELARLVEPNEKWRIRTGEDHTTVINENNTKVFDLLYWASDERLENYVFGDEIENPDPTLGGKAAFIDSQRKISQTKV